MVNEQVDRLGTPMARESELTTHTPYETMTHPRMLAMALQWPVRVHSAPDRLGGPSYLTLRCDQDDGAFIMALTDRHGGPYHLTSAMMQAALLTHLYRYHGYLPDGTRQALAA